MKKFILSIAIFFLFCAQSFSHVEHYKDYNNLEYELFRNNKSIGFHKYDFNRDGESLSIKSEVSFKISKLGVDLYKYFAKSDENYEKGVFKTLGCFCSYPCIARYIIDSNEPSDVIFSRLSTLNLYVNMLKNTKIDRVKPAPPRLSLKMFGGTMDIHEYRNNNEEYLTVMNIDPIVCCIDVSTKKLAYKKKNIQENKKEFKLYRRNKKKNTNDIYASMNLISE